MGDEASVHAANVRSIARLLGRADTTLALELERAADFLEELPGQSDAQAELEALRAERRRAHAIVMHVMNNAVICSGAGAVSPCTLKPEWVASELRNALKLLGPGSTTPLATPENAQAEKRCFHCNAVLPPHSGLPHICRVE